MSAPAAPWNEYRDVAEAMAQSMVDALIVETGADMQLGKPTNFDPDEMLGSRPTPLRAYVVHLDSPLRDVLIIFTSLGRDMIEPMLPAGIRGALAAINIGDDETPGYTIDEPVEFATNELAVDQSDALYLEASYEISMPLGDLRLVLGTGLLESVTCHVNGVEDPWADGVSGIASQTADIDVDMTAADVAAQIDVADVAGGVAPTAEDATAPAAVASDTGAPATAAAGSAIDAFERELAEQEARADAILAGLNPDVALANMARAAEPQVPAVGELQGAARWASLLSGVEVELSAELGRTNLELGDITSLVADRILTLDTMVDEPVTVFVNGTPYATARLVIVDEEYGIEILELLDQPSITGIAPIFSQIAA